jgi:hypothetical protein
MEWDLSASGGADASQDTAWSVTSAAAINVAVGDYLLAVLGFNSDTAGAGTPHAFTQGGLQLHINGAVTKHHDSGTTNGTDSRLVIAGTKVTQNASNAAVTYTCVASAATAGAGLIVRLRQVARLSIMDEWTPDGSVDSLVLNDGQQIWQNMKGTPLRSSLHYTGTSYSIKKRKGRKRYHYHIDPRNPDPGVISGSQRYNYRAEVSDHPWELMHPIGTRKLWSTFYEFPDDTDTVPYSQHATEIDITQGHAGSGTNGPYPDNFPAFYIGLAYQGQNGLSWGNFRIVNKVVDIASPGSGQVPLATKRAKKGDRWDIVVDCLVGQPGRLRIWLKETSAGGAWDLVYDRVENTAWLTDTAGGSNPNVGPNMKLGVYHQGMADEAGVLANEALYGGIGTYQFDLFQGPIRRMVIPSTSVYYSSDYVFDLLETSGLG